MDEDVKILPIERYLPQRRPFMMVDTICSGSEKECKTAFMVNEDLLTLRRGRLSENGILENMAQTCASHIGYVEIHIRKSNKIRVGVVALVKNCRIKSLPRCGEEIETEATLITQLELMSLYHVVVKKKGNVDSIAESDMQVMLREE